MTREEVIDTLKRVCAAFDQKTLDAIAAQVHHEHTFRNLQRELDLKDKQIARVESDNSALERALANKDAELSEKDSKIRDLEKTAGRQPSLRGNPESGEVSWQEQEGIEKSKALSKGRDDEKDDFDGTPGAVSRNDETDVRQSATGECADSMSLSEFRGISGGRPSKYTLADAARKIVHECDMARIPEGAVVIPGGESTETVFHEEHIIVADIYKLSNTAFRKSQRMRAETR